MKQGRTKKESEGEGKTKETRMKVFFWVDDAETLTKVSNNGLGVHHVLKQVLSFHILLLCEFRFLCSVVVFSEICIPVAS
mgnify:FL=1